MESSRGRKYSSRRSLLGIRSYVGAIVAVGALLSSAPAAAQQGAVPCEEGKADVFECANVDLLSRMDVSELGGGPATALNDVWGWTDPETGREYALVGRTDGMAIVDVSEPTRPALMGVVPTRTRSSVWRDIKVYADHAFIVADQAGSHGMQIVDLRRVRSIANPPEELLPDAVYEGFGSAHNVVVNEDSGFAYVVGISVPSIFDEASCGGGLHMVDVRQPQNPVFAGCFSDPRTGRAGTGYTHDAQCVNYMGPDSRYLGREICIGSNENAISIADVTDKSSPVAISIGSYPNVGYTHQGWLTEDHRYFFLDDELDELYFQDEFDRTRTIIFDLVDLENPVVLAEYFGEAYAIDHNQYIVGNRVFQANYTSGLRILDITDVARPSETGYFVTYLGASHKNSQRESDFTSFHRCHDDCRPGEPLDESLSFAGAWSVYPFFESGSILVSSIDEGLFVLDVSDAVSVSAEERTPLPEGNRLVVFPNPASGEASVTWSRATSGPATITLYDALGRQVSSPARVDGSEGTLRLSLAGFPAGLYFVRLTTESSSVSDVLVVTP
jgi:choice-of-anchor B domain-containing protein